MKRISLTLIIVFLLVFFQSTISFAEIIKFNDWKTDEYYYYDVNSYDELYSVFEDLNYEYERCQEELNSQISSLNDEKLDLKIKIESLQDKLETQKLTAKNNSSGALIAFAIIFFIGIIITYNVGLSKSNNAN